jgi:uncharacterized protein (DUF362 family)
MTELSSSQKSGLVTLALTGVQKSLSECGISPDRLTGTLERAGFIEKIIARLSNYNYENLSRQGTLDILLSQKEKYVSGFGELVSAYILSEAAHLSVATRCNLRYVSNIEPFITSRHAECIEEVPIPHLNGRIMIKPNLVSIYDYPETTDRKLLEYVVRVIRKDNPDVEVVIADGPSLFFNSDLIFQDSRLREIAERYEATLLNLNKSRFVKYSGQKNDDNINGDLFVPEDIFEIDFLINVANFKEHNSVGFSGAVKNHFALIAPFQRLKFHRQSSVPTAVNAVYNRLSANFTILDARQVMLGAQQKLYGGYPAEGAGIFYGTNCNNIDTVVLERMRDRL